MHHTYTPVHHHFTPTTYLNSHPTVPPFLSPQARVDTWLHGGRNKRRGVFTKLKSTLQAPAGSSKRIHQSKVLTMALALDYSLALALCSGGLLTEEHPVTVAAVEEAWERVVLPLVECFRPKWPLLERVSRYWSPSCLLLP